MHTRALSLWRQITQQACYLSPLKRSPSCYLGVAPPLPLNAFNNHPEVESNAQLLTVMADTNGKDADTHPARLPGLRNATGRSSFSRSRTEDNESMVVGSEPPAEKMEEQIERAYVEAEQERLLRTATSYASEAHTDVGPALLRDMLNISHVLTDGAAAITDDSFNKCFTCMEPDPWNWNAYLWPQWAFGVFFRHCILFPLRLVVLLICNFIFIGMFFTIQLLYKKGPRRRELELMAIRLTCGAWMMAWNAVVKYHGPKPTPGPNKIWVSNHTSMIDYVILSGHSPFAVIMQLQGGWVRFLQTKVLNSLGCLWFNRTDLKDRHIVATRMKEHVANPESVPLLVFPEGTCVNNEYCVLFKRGAFDLGATVCPIALKYNKMFVDAFWNSKRQPFSQHIYRLMSSWALVCDVWFLEPQTQRRGETPDQFAGRVQKMIADTAGLKVVPWDGYLKYYNLGQAKPALVEKRRSVIADILRRYLPAKSNNTAAEPADHTLDRPDGDKKTL